MLVCSSLPGFPLTSPVSPPGFSSVSLTKVALACSQQCSVPRVPVDAPRNLSIHAAGSRASPLESPLNLTTSWTEFTSSLHSMRGSGSTPPHPLPSDKQGPDSPPPGHRVVASTPLALSGGYGTVGSLPSTSALQMPHTCRAGTACTERQLQGTWNSVATTTCTPGPWTRAAGSALSWNYSGPPASPPDGGKSRANFRVCSN